MAIAFDKFEKHLVVADSDNNRIQVSLHVYIYRRVFRHKGRRGEVRV